MKFTEKEFKEQTEDFENCNVCYFDRTFRSTQKADVKGGEAFACVSNCWATSYIRYCCVCYSFHFTKFRYLSQYLSNGFVWDGELINNKLISVLFIHLVLHIKMRTNLMSCCVY